MEDFESLPAYQALVVAAAGKPERSMGDSVIPEEPPQWQDVRRQAKELAKTAPDQLAVHIYLIQAETNINGFVGFSNSLQATLSLLQDGWDSIYPEPDLDDPDDMYYARVNLMRELSEQPKFLEVIPQLPLVSVRGLGEFSARDMDICAGTISGTDEERERCQDGLIRGAFSESDSEMLQSTAESLDSLVTACAALEQLFAEKTGQPDVLSLGRLKKIVESSRGRFHQYADEYLAAPPAVAQAQEELAADSQPPGGGAVSTDQVLTASSLKDRHMVQAAFDAILNYYQQHEPSSPMRIFAYRAREFVDKSFFDLLQELAPAYREDLPTLLQQLQKQPVAFLLSDSYTRFLSGETLPPAMPATHHASDDPSLPAGEADVSMDTSSQPASNPGHSNPVIGSREEVLERLQDIEAFFLQREPASPIPLIIAEMRKLVSKRFVELLAEFSRSLPEAPVESSE